MFTTAEIAGFLATAAAPFGELLGEISVDGLLTLVRSELGDDRILDSFRPHGTHVSRALAPRTILHVVSGNTPHAGLQSLIRGLLLGSHNLCKLPAGGLVPEIAAFQANLPAELAARVELAEILPDDWLARADAVIVFGSDATVEEFRSRIRPDQTFIAHGHRVSLAFILEDPHAKSARLAARAVSLFDQRGCLSPQVIYVRGDARHYAGELAREMDRFNLEQPRAALHAHESAGIGALREDWRFRAANDPASFALWESQGSTAWTVLFDGDDPTFTGSPLNRTVFVKPLPDDLPSALLAVRPHLSAAGLWPATPGNATWLGSLDLGLSRVCPLERMQSPPLTWHQDGVPPLASLVRWIDFEPDEAA